jgi:hypothetical protein
MGVGRAAGCDGEGAGCRLTRCSTAVGEEGGPHWQKSDQHAAGAAGQDWLAWTVTGLMGWVLSIVTTDGWVADTATS